MTDWQPADNLSRMHPAPHLMDPGIDYSPRGCKWMNLEDSGHINSALITFNMEGKDVVHFFSYQVHTQDLKKEEKSPYCFSVFVR